MFDESKYKSNPGLMKFIVEFEQSFAFQCLLNGNHDDGIWYWLELCPLKDLKFVSLAIFGGDADQQQQQQLKLL